MTRVKPSRLAKRRGKVKGQALQKKLPATSKPSTKIPRQFLWRTVYLLKMPGWGRRLRVAVDWTLDLVCTRDDVQLGVHRLRQSRVETTEEERP